MSEKTIVITGGAGFLGARLIRALLDARDSGQPAVPGFDRIVSLDMVACPVPDARVSSLVGSVTDPELAARAIGPGTVAVFHLAAVVSGQAEADFELGMSVNVDGTRTLLDACRLHGRSPFFFFSSSLAVFGANCPEIVGDEQVLRPRSSYGAQKAIGELLVQDCSRKGYVRGITGRLPTVVIRPGKPNAAASSFASSILREPIGGEPAVCAVAPDLPLWISSPDAVIANLVRLFAMDSARLDGAAPINLPGITVTPQEMIAALQDRFGSETAALVSIAPDPKVEAIVASWPSRFDTASALALGLQADEGIAQIIEAYCAMQETA